MTNTQSIQQNQNEQKYTKVNSTAIQQCQYSTLGPIHSFETSFCVQSRKNQAVRPAFGTKSIRQTKQLNGNKQSDVIAYSRINYEKNQKYCDRFESLSTKKVPFMSCSSRFFEANIPSPGPANYNLPQLKKYQSQKNNNKTKFYGAMYSPVKRLQTKIDQILNEDKISAIQKTKEYDFRQISYINPLRDMGQIYQIQQRIKRKRQQSKYKYMKLRQLMKKPQNKKLKPLAKQQQKNYKQNQTNNSSFGNQKWQKTKILVSRQNELCKNIDLRKLTSQFLPKNVINFQKQQYRAGSNYKNFIQKHNHHPIFIEKQNQNLYSSYIVKKDGPGPGYYQKRTKKQCRRQSSIANKFFK